MHHPFSYMNLGNANQIESIYSQYVNSPESVHPSWRHFFQGMQFAQKESTEEKEDIRSYLLIDAYRRFGHLKVPINPIETKTKVVDELALENFGFSHQDLNLLVPTHGVLKKLNAPLKELIEQLEQIYCTKFGVEYMHLSQEAQRKWFQEKLEREFGIRSCTIEQKKEILTHLNRAEIFETFIHTRYVGQKRFSLEGLETLIPVLNLLVNLCGEKKYDELLVGMSHRGRLNVLTNILKKSYKDVFCEFEDYQHEEEVEGDGDVKYHKGFSSDVKTLCGHSIALSLTSNPSHLESVNPVLLGKTRAKQERGLRAIPVNIHGDSAIAGQGVVYETLQLQKIKGYSVGGTLHIVLNNQIGFTTLPEEYRSTHYSTDIAKGFESPVLHVNAEDPESCLIAATLAFEMRELFGSDVFIELNGYRKYGHNETDEPSFTQPLQYQIIKKKHSIRRLYVERLTQEGAVEREVASKLEKEFKEELDYALNHLKIDPHPSKSTEFGEEWKGLHPPRKDEVFEPVQTSVKEEILKQIIERGHRLPEEFSLHLKIQKVLKEREEKLQEHIDWALAEFLAFGSLLLEGIGVRLSGQDSQRGTFSHRHAVWVDQKNAQKYFPLQHLKKGQAPFHVYNSILSEFGVLGFEFGYSLSAPHHLVLWEAQFGDFANGAQVITDQYLASSGSKWSRYSGIILLLPHGYEGQGAEHSSARLERYLQLAGGLNMQIVNLTSPAQYFHILRRQMHRPYRYPLVIMSPKMLLRHPECVSSLKSLSEGYFEEVLDDPLKPVQAERVIFCSGKIYFELCAIRKEKGLENRCALLRIEQLYPLHEEKIKEILCVYSKAKEYLWVQEEPENMGAWSYIAPLLGPLLGDKTFSKVARQRGSATATGSHKRHQKQQKEILEKAFRGL